MMSELLFVAKDLSGATVFHDHDVKIAIAIQIPASNVPKFQPSKTLKDAVNRK